MSEIARHWLTFARQDLRMAELAMSEAIYNQACFHAQQCAEKSVKGYLEHLGQTPPRTHLMADLLFLMPVGLLDTLQDSLLALDRFYLPVIRMLCPVHWRTVCLAVKMRRTLWRRHNRRSSVSKK